MQHINILQVHFYMFRMSTTPINRSTQNCNYSLRYCSYFFVQVPPCNVAKSLATLQNNK